MLNINLTENDVVIGLAASGRTPYVLGAIEYANSIGAITGSITCSKSSDLSKVSQYPIEVPVGAEIVTGSTRMKAGTAQKMILNMISTTIMIKLGKVFSGYMVDVKTSNQKLIERAKRIIMKTANCDYEKASDALKKSGNDVKTAIVMILWILIKICSWKIKSMWWKCSKNNTWKLEIKRLSYQIDLLETYIKLHRKDGKMKKKDEIKIVTIGADPAILLNW